MTAKLRVATIVGTRPEIIKLSEVIKYFDTVFDHHLIHTGQNWDYELSEVFFKDLGVRSPDAYLGVVGDDLGETIGRVIANAYSHLAELRPDALLVLGDTNSALSVLAAKRLKIPVFHMEAGNRCFDENVPEEVNRRVIDHVSDVNLAYTEHARRNLLAEGLSRQYVFVTGSPMREVIEAHRAAITSSDVLSRLGLESGGYFVASLHREENVDSERNLLALADTLAEVAERHSLPVLFSVHPRTRARLESSGITLHPRVIPSKPLGLFDYLHLQEEAFCVLSDSGTLAEESSMLGFAGVSMRTSTERPEALEAGGFVLGGLSSGGVLAAIEIAVERAAGRRGTGWDVPDYRAADVSRKVAGIVAGWTAVIDKRVWFKA
ncbi:MAG: UDP-N-acetylglucosamine 2-epimerase (non-hydrolyzing) [Actinomycetota bacterium]|nr:UDP-N-acetylglucosamine 2-epimerase (non-hydrolyzing) [Actinomycetota bacterium]